MTWRPGPNADGEPRELYFFLSYARSVPVALPDQSDTDFWVRQFFEDLTEAVVDRAGEDGPTAAGFFDGLLTPGADLRYEPAEALGYAHSFVPLYSPGYFNSAWATGELAAFRARLARQGQADAARHIVPVVWSPLPPWETRDEIDEALAIVAKSEEYADNGMRALCKLGAYRSLYERLVGSLAERIVTVVHNSPLRHSAASPVTVHEPQPSGPALVVSLVSATDNPHAWRPFAGTHELAVVDYIATRAQRLGLPTQVTGLPEIRRLAQRRPCILVIESGVDPQAVRTAVDGLPRWVVPLVVVPGERGSADVAATTAILHSTKFAEVRPVYGVDEFEHSAPLLVSEARKQFLRYGPVEPPAGGSATARPSLRR